jgi:signal transduction histidine kinase
VGGQVKVPIPLLTTELRHEYDVVAARQRARQIAAALHFDAQDQTRISTAVSELARNAFMYAGGGRVLFSCDRTSPECLVIHVTDTGRGISDLTAILEGRYTSRTGMGMGLIGAKRLMDRFDVETSENGTRVVIGKRLPRREDGTPVDLSQVARELAGSSPQNPFEEVQLQNQELLRAMDQLQARQTELDRLNQELSDTNRGVMALYAELDEKAMQIERTSELKTRFVSNVSHEFRTPLSSILGLSRLLLDRADGDLTPEQEKQVEYIRQSAASLAELVNDLLDTAKIEAGKVTVHSQPFEVTDLFSSLRGMFRPLLVSDTVVLRFEDTAGLPTLCTDEGKIAQILRNFISNALKFTEYGTVCVAAAVAPDNHIEFSVRDDGIGIAPEDLDVVFADFTQLEGRVQRRVKGTGLGLPLSRGLAELLGGTVSVTSEIGVGSTFRAVLPQWYPGPQ